MSAHQLIKLLLYFFQVVVEGCDLLSAQLETCGLVAAAVKGLQRHQDYRFVGFR